MSIEQNKTVIRREVEEAWNRGDFSGVPEMISPGFVYHTPEGDLKGQDGFKRWVSIWRTACPDFHMEVVEIVGEGNTVAARLKWSGTFTGKFQGYQPTGKKIGAREAWFFYFRNGKDLGPVPYGNLNAVLQEMGIEPRAVSK